MFKVSSALRKRNPLCSRRGFSVDMAYFRYVMRIYITIFMLICGLNTGAQVLGGRSVFNFLRFSHTPQLTALGGVNISQPSDDAGMTFQNPVLFTAAQHTQLNAVFNDFYGGIKVFHLSMAFHQEKLNTDFTGGLVFFNYGNTTETDAAGNILGKFRPVDFVLQAGASRRYLERWRYGMNLKFISSSYGQYRATGLAVDVAVGYRDTANGLSAAFMIKNAGTQLTAYAGEKEELPFELQAGITKRLAHAPFSFSLTGQRLHQPDIFYADTVFNSANGYRNPSSSFTIGKLMDHLVLGATVHVHPKIELQAGYNFLRRRELTVGNTANGLNGFSLGTGVFLGKISLRYARAWYQSNSAVNQLGLNLPLNQYMHFGK